MDFLSAARFFQSILTASMVSVAAFLNDADGLVALFSPEYQQEACKNKI